MQRVERGDNPLLKYLLRSSNLARASQAHQFIHADRQYGCNPHQCRQVGLPPATYVIAVSTIAETCPTSHLSIGNAKLLGPAA